MLFVVLLSLIVIVMKLVTEVRKDISYTKKVRELKALLDQ